MLRHAPVRALIGLAIGFVAAYATFFASDRLGEPDRGPVVQTSAGSIDFDAYCADQPGDLRAVVIAPNAQGWRCIGDIDGFFTSVEIDTLAACRWQYGPATDVRLVDADDPDGWQCVDDIVG